MNKMNISVLPIPNLVFFPHSAVPIFIAEPEYVRMVKDCLAENSYLAISMAEPMDLSDGHRMSKFTPQKICGMGRPIILNEYEDNGLKILVQGQARVKLGRVLQNLPYLIYEAEIIHDLPFKETFQYQEIERLEKIFNLWILENIPDSIEREIFHSNLTSIRHLIDYLSMFLISDRHTRQLILENQNIFERIQLLNTLLKGDRPYNEDFMAVKAIKNFEFIDKVTKLAH